MTTLRHNTQYTDQQNFSIGNGEIWPYTSWLFEWFLPAVKIIDLCLADHMTMGADGLGGALKEVITELRRPPFCKNCALLKKAEFSRVFGTFPFCLYNIDALSLHTFWPIQCSCLLYHKNLRGILRARLSWIDFLLLSLCMNLKEFEILTY